jgi:hypothetical protein
VRLVVRLHAELIHWQLQTEAHAAPPPHSARHCLQPVLPDEDEVDDVEEVLDVVAFVASVHRPSPSCAQT